MIQPKDFEQRLEQLDWTLYRLAKEFAEYRAVEGDISPASRYHSTISKAIENPEKSRLETIEDIVKVLNGELIIFWEPEKIVSIRLEDNTLDALQKRADQENKTINEIAQKLLLQSLSGFSPQQSINLTELIIDNQTKIDRSWHPLIASAYSSVHQWLGERPEAKGYQDLEYDRHILNCLEPTNLKNISFQYYSLFPRHHFQIAHILDRIIHSPRLLNRLQYYPSLSILDVGCGMGAATTALIEIILRWQVEGKINQNIEIISLGIDPNIYEITIYSKLMQELKQKVSPFNIDLVFKPICEPIPKAIITAIRYLQAKCQELDKPYLSNLFLTQFDLASSISEDELLKRQQAQQLRELGLEPNLILENDRDILQEQAIAYKQLLEEISVQNLYLIILGTKQLNKQIQSITNVDNLKDNLEEISQSINLAIGSNHIISNILTQEEQVNFENPLDSYWFNKNINSYCSKFYSLCQNIRNKKLENDNQWNKLVSTENLQLAWVKARKNLLNESLYDEIEIRIFEDNLSENLSIIQEKLIYEAQDIIPKNEEISYKFIKGISSSRPKHLSRLEEEVIEIALIETIGKEKTQDFYSYTLSEDSETEDLYESYFTNYKKFLEESKNTAEQYQEDGAVIRTDIKSYYTNILQGKLLEISHKELSITSQRIEWLLKQLIEKTLDGHESGKGINQGSITSGFYANFYLKPIDDFFKQKTHVKFYRYVDDIIIIVRNKIYLEKIKYDLKKKLEHEDIGLNMNEDKTEIYENISDFIKMIQPIIKDTKLEQLNKKFNIIMASLWRINSYYRTQFEKANKNNDHSLWWKLIDIYSQCLYSINIFVTPSYLSRKIYKELVVQNYKNKSNITFPVFPTKDNFMIIENWKKDFEKLNQDWISKKNELKNEIVKLFLESINNLHQTTEQLNNLEPSQNENKQKRLELNIERRKDETKIRFAIHKLLILGFDFDLNRDKNEIIDLICSPNLIILRNSILDVIVNLAVQGHTEAINQIIKYYENHQQDTSEYIRAVILEALRFLPNLELQHWELIFKSSIKQTSDIERLKATETWLYLGEISKAFVKKKNIQDIVNALNSVPAPFSRLKKNYILILGMFARQKLSQISLTKEEQQDYLLRNTFKIAENGKVSDLFKYPEPAMIKQYYNTKQTGSSDGKRVYSPTF